MTTQSIKPFVNSPDETVAEVLNQAMQHTGAGRADGTETPLRQNQLKYVPAGTGATFWGPGERMTFLITGKETGGAFFMAEISVRAGRRHTAAHPPTRGRIVPHPRRRADCSSGQKYNHCIGWRFCFSSPRNRSFLQKYRRWLREGPGPVHAGRHRRLLYRGVRPCSGRFRHRRLVSEELIGAGACGFPKVRTWLLPPA